LICLFFLSCFQSVYSQIQFKELLGPNLHTDVDGAFFFNAIHPIPHSQFSEEKHVNLASITHPDERISFQLIDQLSDKMGFEHFRFQAYIDEIILQSVQVVIHSKNNHIQSVNGWHYSKFPKTLLNQTVKIPEADALKNALDFVNAYVYKWELPSEEALLKVWEGNSNATYFPKALEMIIPNKWEQPSKDVKRVYRFDIYAHEPLSRQFIYVDIQDGSIINTQDQLHIANTEGKADTRYSGLQRIFTDSISPTSFRLRETTRGKGIETYDMQRKTAYGGAVDFTDSNNYWQNKNANQDEIATDAHWGAEMTYDYFWNKFGRKSFDNKDAKIRSYVHYGTKYNNAFWNGSVMTYGDGDDKRFTPLTCIDVCGHEVTHAVTTNTAGLIYSYESGALNESFSDIFGNSIEFYAKPSSFFWNIGEDITPNGTGIRLMQNPNAKNHPDTYKGTRWRTGPTDNGGVHSNSGVQNYWFYLLCEGGSGTNDNSDAFNVTKIGINKAEQIAYRNLTTYLTPSSQYIDARYYAIQSAADLYGDCSQEVIAVTNAWYAVGVGDRYDSAVVVADFIGDTLFCSPTAKVSFMNRSSNAKGYQWKFGDGSTSILTHPQHDYSNYGHYDVTLIAQGCFFNKYDTLTKKAYIRVDSNFDICDAFIMPLRSNMTVRACKGFVYDNGGEENYTTRVRDTLTIDAFPCDSIVFNFTEFDYEDKFDSVFVYDGPSTSSPLIGGYTGQTLPNGGKLVTTSGYATIQHFSDPYVVGTGFKASFEAYRPALSLVVSKDTTVCIGSTIDLKALGSGGFVPDLRYWWNGKSGDSTLTITVDRDTSIAVQFGDICTELYLFDTIRIQVLPELKTQLKQDTLFCYKENGVFIDAKGAGGLVANHQFTWLDNPTAANPRAILPLVSQSYSVVLSDGCTFLNDTASIFVKVRKPLAISTSSDTLLCRGTQTTMKVSTSGGKSPRNIWWSHALGTDSFAANWNNVDTTYQIHVSDGCTGENDTNTIRIQYLTDLQLELSKDTTICQGTEADIFARLKGGDSLNYAYKWSDGLPDIYRHIVTPTKPEYYAVTATDNCSKTELVDSLLVVVYSEISVSINAQDTACSGEKILLRGLVNGGRVATYQFSWNDGLGNNPNANANPTSDTTYSLIVSDGCSENDTAFKKIIVRDPLSIVLSNDTSICSGDSIDVISKGQGGLSNQYDFYWDGGPGVGNKHRIAPRFTTTYLVTLNDGCSNFAEKSMEVTVIPRPNVAFYPNPTKQCLGEGVQFYNTTSNISNAKFLWKFDDGQESTLESPRHVYNQTGYFDVSLFIENEFGCTSETTRDSAVQILQTPLAAFATDPEVVDILNPTYNFINNSQFADKYSWTFGDGTSDTLRDTEHTYSDTGYYWVGLEVENSIGCKDNAALLVRVKDLVLVYVPNAFTPNNDNTNDRFHPNVRGIRDYEFSIYNRWGERLFFTRSAEDSWTGLDPNGKPFPSGVYWYILTGKDIDRNKIQETGKILLLK